MNSAIFELANNIIKEDDPRRIRVHQFSVKPGKDDLKVCNISVLPSPINGEWVLDYSKIDIPSDSINNSFSIRYRSSFADTGREPVFVIGDIGIRKNKGKITGNYHLETKTGKDSFENAIVDKHISTFLLSDKNVSLFVGSFKKGRERVRQIIKDFIINEEYQALFIHFDFSHVTNCQHWYEIPKVLSKMDDCFVSYPDFGIFREEDENTFILKKTFIYSLCSGDKKNDVQFPNFSYDRQKDTMSFTEDQMSIVFYYERLLSLNRFTVHKNYEISVVLKRDNKSASFDSFLLFRKELDKRFEKKKETLKQERKAENMFSLSLEEVDIQDLFKLSETSAKLIDVASFDILFFNVGQTKLCFRSINNLHCSALKRVLERLRNAKKDVLEDQKWYPNYITKALDNIVGEVRFRMMIEKVLPTIYEEGDFNINFLPYYIDKVAFIFRNKLDEKEIKQLKADYFYLTFIQKKGRNTMSERQESESYRLGKETGNLSFFVSKVIGSFEKSYAGLIKQRCPELSDAESLITLCYGKAILHKDDVDNNGNKFPIDKISFINKKIKDLLENFSASEYESDVFAQGFYDGYLLSRYLDNKLHKKGE